MRRSFREPPRAFGLPRISKISRASSSFATCRPSGLSKEKKKYLLKLSLTAGSDWYTCIPTQAIPGKLLKTGVLKMLPVGNIKLDLSKETLVDRIVDILEDRILKGDLPPSTKLSETLVAKEFGVSRIPAREALQRLQEMNLVRRTPLGREVARFSLEEFREIYELKNVVEAFGAMKGALRATDEDLKKIQSVVDNMHRCLNGGKLKRLNYLNHQFHDLLVHCSGNRKLIETYLALVKQVRWSASLSLLQFPARPQQALNEHKAIFEAFKHGRARDVRVLLETHSQNNMERICSQLEEKEKSRKQMEAL